MLEIHGVFLYTMNYLPIYCTKLDVDDMFHWTCHAWGIYLTKSLYGLFWRLPNSIYVHDSLVRDPLDISRCNIFICYLYYRLYYCTSCQFYYGTECVCGVCTLYLHRNVRKIVEKWRFLQDEFQDFLKQSDSPMFDPFFQHVQFDDSNKLPKNIVYPRAFPTFAVVCAKQEPESK